MRVTDRERLGEQYSDDARLALRQETHRRYSERPDNTPEWVLGLLAPAPGDLVLDAGAGNGAYHPALRSRGVRIVAVEREMGMIRSVSEPMAGYVAGDVTTLPLSSDATDHSMANHMLYHVPDIPAALMELARVTRPGGRVALTTNGDRRESPLQRLHERAALELGIDADVPITTDRFGDHNLRQVRRVFPDAAKREQVNALVFRTAEPVLAYYGSGPVDSVREPAADTRRELVGRMDELVRQRIAADREFRIPKRLVCYLATSP
ncbi:MAG: class I SAM-dependent methyltransferase [Chloroflexota bacterium]|nr:class I SAM-dependent methyltransferase [Chloroflexota bacterium]